VTGFVRYGGGPWGGGGPRRQCECASSRSWGPGQVTAMANFPSMPSRGEVEGRDFGAFRFAADYRGGLRVAARSAGHVNASRVLRSGGERFEPVKVWFLTMTPTAQ